MLLIPEGAETLNSRPGADLSLRHFLSFADLPAQEGRELLDLAALIKAGHYADLPLLGQSVALVFEKSSTRTRVSFEVAVHQLGGTPIYLTGRDTQMGRGEPLRDTARVLARFVQGVVMRTYSHADLEELARWSGIPVINALTDLLHPCQLLADLLTMEEEFGSLEGRKVAWIGDGNNMANSWLEAAALFGFDLRLAIPPAYQPDSAILARARNATAILLTEDPAEAAEGAEVISTDVWTSMGQESENEQRRQDFLGFQVNQPLLRLASPTAIVLHCLPAHRGEEITEEVLEGPSSRVWDEAENRLHVQKALLARMLG